MYDGALLSLKQREHIVLKIDKDATDAEAFGSLKIIEDHIVDFVEQGNQLYIHSSIAGNGKSSWALRLVQTYFDKI